MGKSEAGVSPGHEHANHGAGRQANRKCQYDQSPREGDWHIVNVALDVRNNEQPEAKRQPCACNRATDGGVGYDRQRNKPTGGPLRECSPACGTSALSDGSSVVCMRQNQEVGNRLKQDLGKGLGDGSAHLGACVGIERLRKGALPHFVAGPLRITIPKAVAPAMEP